MKRIFAYSPSKFITQMVELAVKGAPDLEVFTYNELPSALEQLPQLLPTAALIDVPDGAGTAELARALAGVPRVLWIAPGAPEGAAVTAAQRPLAPAHVRDFLLG